MCTEYSRAVLRVAIAQWCQNLGWQAVQSTPLEMLTDILERHILQMGRTVHNYSEKCEYFKLLSCIIFIRIDCDRTLSFCNKNKHDHLKS